MLLLHRLWLEWGWLVCYYVAGGLVVNETGPDDSCCSSREREKPE